MRITWVGVPKAARRELRRFLREEQVGSEFLVCSDKGADQKAKAEILERAWAFRPEFLAAHARKGIDASTFKAVVGDRCEDANEAVLALIKDVKHFVQDAIRADGRGNLLNSYDNEEREHRVEFTDEKGEKRSEFFFIYRRN